uniref:Uncharacterized protein n=1 Tax=Anguilla anguilla TaxID=7936 RepID=A0A0E9VC34_ANGAN
MRSVPITTACILIIYFG